MSWIFFGLVLGMICAAVLVAGVFRVHDEWEWMRPKKACMRCELPRSGADFLPVVGDVLMQGRCRGCKEVTPWQYPAIEAVIVGLITFHVWRYAFGVWIPDLGTAPVWAWVMRDVLFTLFFVIVFVYDAKFSLIMDQYTVPATLTALVLNMALGFSVWSLLAGMVVLGVFFAAQHALLSGRLMGSGDIRMGVMMGAMLGIASGLVATLLAYVAAALIGGWLLLSHRRKASDAIPFGTWLAIASFVLLVWAPQIMEFIQ